MVPALRKEGKRIVYCRVINSFFQNSRCTLNLKIIMKENFLASLLSAQSFIKSNNCFCIFNKPLVFLFLDSITAFHKLQIFSIIVIVMIGSKKNKKEKRKESQLRNVLVFSSHIFITPNSYVKV